MVWTNHRRSIRLNQSEPLAAIDHIFRPMIIPLLGATGKSHKLSQMPIRDTWNDTTYDMATKKTKINSTDKTSTRIPCEQTSWKLPFHFHTTISSFENAMQTEKRSKSRWRKGHTDLWRLSMILFQDTVVKQVSTSNAAKQRKCEFMTEQISVDRFLDRLFATGA